MLEWTKNKPTERGWYWITQQREKAGRIVAVRRFKDGLVVDFGNDLLMPVADVTNAAWWAGPIPEPTEPKADVPR